jgi:hypothetical protein
MSGIMANKALKTSFCFVFGLLCKVSAISPLCNYCKSRICNECHRLFHARLMYLNRSITLAASPAKVPFASASHNRAAHHINKTTFRRN